MDMLIFRNLVNPMVQVATHPDIFVQYSTPGQSASDRMSNGNIFVNASGGQGGAGVMYEVDSLNNIIWGPFNAQSQKAFRYECDHPGIQVLKRLYEHKQYIILMPLVLRN